MHSLRKLILIAAVYDAQWNVHSLITSPTDSVWGIYRRTLCICFKWLRAGMCQDSLVNMANTYNTLHYNTLLLHYYSILLINCIIVIT